MLISTHGRYALRVLADMAEHQGDGYVPLRDIARRQEISEKYLESIVKLLVRDGLLQGLRGKGGGYRLVKKPEDMPIYPILSLMEGTLAPVACLEEARQLCPRMASCRTLPLWQGLDRVIRDYLDRFTLADLMHREDGGFDYMI